MAKDILPVDFKNDILAAAMNGSRKFKITDNGDGTVTLEDVSTYDQVGSEFGAAQINATNQAVNDSVDKSKVLNTLEENAASTDNENVAGSKALAELNKRMGNVTGWVVDESTGEITGYTTEIGGADTVFPFSGGKALNILAFFVGNFYKNGGNVKITNAIVGKRYFVLAQSTGGTGTYASQTYIGAEIENRHQYSNVVNLDTIKATNETVVWNPEKSSYSDGRFYGNVVFIGYDD